MNQDISVRVRDIIGGPHCVSAEDGQRLYEKIAPLVRQGESVTLSFRGVDTVISAFLNAAIGQLYGEFSDELVKRLVSVEELSDIDMQLVDRVAENAIVYFENAEQFDRAWTEELEEETGDEEK